MAVIIAAALILWVASTPLVADSLSWQLEKKYPPVDVDKAPEADVVVVLGGMVSRTRPEPYPVNLGEAVDRARLASQLWKAGAAGTILVSGGNLPWVGGKPEATLVRALLVELGVPAEAILTEAESRNTRENAVASARIWREEGFRSGLLVTSAQHMPRALRTFAAAGLPLHPAPTDFRANTTPHRSMLDLLPQAEALSRTTSALKEVLGLTAYGLAGWV